MATKEERAAIEQAKEMRQAQLDYTRTNTQRLKQEIAQGSQSGDLVARAGSRPGTTPQPVAAEPGAAPAAEKQGWWNGGTGGIRASSRNMSAQGSLRDVWAAPDAATGRTYLAKDSLKSVWDKDGRLSSGATGANAATAKADLNKPADGRPAPGDTFNSPRSMGDAGTDWRAQEADYLAGASATLQLGVNDGLGDTSLLAPAMKSASSLQAEADAASAPPSSLASWQKNWWERPQNAAGRS
jgi:hypothetical protein